MSDCIELTVVARKQNTSIIVVAASRLIFAVARDGVLPLSWWISQVGEDGQPRHAVTVVFIVAALLLCSILPSTVAFTSLVSAGGLPLIASYGLIGLMRLTQTRTKFRSTRFKLGSFSTFFYAATAISNALIFMVNLLCFSIQLFLTTVFIILGCDIPIFLPSHRCEFQLRKCYQRPRWER